MATILGCVVGDNAYAQPFPAQSFLTGLFGAALGIKRAECDRLAVMQDSMEICWLIHREPQTVEDFQTADLSTPHMLKHTVHHDALGARVLKRGGGDPEGRKVRQRDILFNVDMTAIIGWTLDDLSVETVLHALDFPAETLTIGAKWALPSESLAGTILTAQSMEDAITEVTATHKALTAYVPLKFGAKPTGPFFELSTRTFNIHAYNEFGGQYRYEIRQFA
jgi:CRISPR system Cascade subunit CasD